MDLTKFNALTPDEIDTAIRAAHKARAIAVRDMFQAAGRWLAHPHFGHRTA